MSINSSTARPVGGLGKTVIVVVEHHQAVMAHADWIIDLGLGPDTTAAGSSSGRRPVRNC